MPVGIQTGHWAARLLPRASAAFFLGNGEGGGSRPPTPTHPLLLLITSLPNRIRIHSSHSSDEEVKAQRQRDWMRGPQSPSSLSSS